MKAIIKKSRISGTIEAPPSKSLSHRTLIAASLSQGISALRNLSDCTDVLITVTCLKELGADIQIRGKTTLVSKSNLLKGDNRPRRINCADSGTSARFLTAVAAVTGKRVTIDGSRRLRERPMAELIRLLRLNGAKIVEKNNKSHLPLEIRPGILSGGNFNINTDDSSQFLSALLMISPCMKEQLTLNISGSHSRPYVDLTTDVMKKFGLIINSSKNWVSVPGNQNLQARNLVLAGDYSSASYFFTGALMAGSSISVSNLAIDSRQADRKFLTIARQIGAAVEQKRKEVKIAANGEKFKGISLSMGDIPDLVPTISILAGKTSGPIIIRDIGHLKYKESDRIMSLSHNLKLMGLRVKITPDSLTVFPGPLQGTELDSFNDHRICMAFSIAALAARGETVISGAESVNKSYPAFFSDLKKVGAKVRLIS